MAVKTANLYIFPWCFADEGIEHLASYIRDLGITHLGLTSQYHAGFFLYGTNPKRRVHMLEDGVTYFRPTGSFYADGPIKPTASKLCNDTDLFGDICVAAQKVGLKIMAWHVCLHNTRLGLLHPECTVQNVYGDSLPHALTPAHPACRTFVKGTVADMVEHYPLESIFLEAPNYRGRIHGGSWVSGHHHERDGVYLRPLEQELMNLSFNPADVEIASQQGIDMAGLHSAVRAHMDRYFAMAPCEPDGLPSSIEQFLDQTPALADLQACYRQIEESLLQEIRQIAEPRDVKLVGSASPSIDVVGGGAYGETEQRTAELVSTARAGCLPHQQLQFTVRMGFNTPGMGVPLVSEEQTCRMIRVIADNGADGVGFYNYGECARQSVEWIKPALKGIGLG
jgi:hypothetical protein